MKPWLEITKFSEAKKLDLKLKYTEDSVRLDVLMAKEMINRLRRDPKSYCILECSPRLRAGYCFNLFSKKGVANQVALYLEWSKNSCGFTDRYVVYNLFNTLNSPYALLGGYRAYFICPLSKYDLLKTEICNLYWPIDIKTYKLPLDLFGFEFSVTVSNEFKVKPSFYVEKFLFRIINNGKPLNKEFITWIENNFCYGDCTQFMTNINYIISKRCNLKLTRKLRWN